MKAPQSAKYTDVMRIYGAEMVRAMLCPGEWAGQAPI